MMPLRRKYAKFPNWQSCVILNAKEVSFFKIGVVTTLRDTFAANFDQQTICRLKKFRPTEENIRK